MQLQIWADKNIPEDNLLWKSGYWEQIVFVRDEISRIFSQTYDEYKEIKDNVQVISTHRSKSILLPVYRMFLLSGEKFTMRYNFYDWKVSVDSDQEIVVDFGDLFIQDKEIHECYCEGFQPEWVFGSYLNNKSKFTVEIFTKYQVYTFFWLISKYMKKMNNRIC